MRRTTMRSTLILPLALLAVACSTSTPSSSRPPPVTPTQVVIPAQAAAPAAPTPPSNAFAAATNEGITGTIGGKAFVAHIALMTARDEVFTRCSTANKPDGQCSTDTDGHPVTISTIMLFERPVTCADVRTVRGQRRGFVPLSPGERFIEIAIDSRWPVAAGSTWTSTAGRSANGREDPVSIVFKSTTTSFNGIPLGDGSVATGAVRFPTATLAGGVLVMEAASTNPKTVAAGAVRGSVPLAICR